MDEESVIKIGGGRVAGLAHNQTSGPPGWSFLYVTRKALKFTQYSFNVPMHALAHSFMHTHTG